MVILGEGQGNWKGTGKMNRKELTAAQEAGQTVAYSQYDGIDSDYASEVRLVDVKATRQVSNSTYSHYTHDAPGVNVEYVSGNRSGEQKVVQSRELVSTWEDYTARKAARALQEQQRQNSLDNTKAAAEYQVKQIKALYKEATGQDAGYGKVDVSNNSYRSRDQYRPATKYTVTVDTDVMDVLLAAAK